MHKLQWASETSTVHNDVLGEDIECTKYTADYSYKYNGTTIVSLTFTVTHISKIMGFDLFSANWSSVDRPVKIPLPHSCASVEEAKDACLSVLHSILWNLKFDIEAKTKTNTLTKLETKNSFGCPHGYSECICSPEYIATNYPDWYKELGSPTICDIYEMGQCQNGEHFDDEDK